MNKNVLSISVLALSFLYCSCSQWTEVRHMDYSVTLPPDQDPELWAWYTERLRDYKEGEHFLTYGRLFNSPSQAASEKDFMRCLPDSLDFVSLENAANFSRFDAEDMPVMKEKGIKVLYQVDYAALVAEDPAETARLADILKQAISSVEENGLDGWSFTGAGTAADQAHAEASALIVSTLSRAKAEGQWLVYEGNPSFIAEGDKGKIDLYVIDTDQSPNITDVKLRAALATGSENIPQERILLSARAGSSLADGAGTEQNAISGMTGLVVSAGPFAGLAILDIDRDYHHEGTNYRTVRRAIQTLNPSR